MLQVAERQYHVMELLGRGGFGTVYRARLSGPGGFAKEVALKVLRASHSEEPELAQRLRDEARMLAMVRHRAIVHVHDLCQLDGHWSVVMELVEGADLSELIGLGPVPAGPALEIIEELASALGAAWTAEGPDGQALRIRHRDLKPANIRVTRHGEVKVLDFGIARADFAGREAQTGAEHFGTPAYMSPERLDFADGPAADLYALGCVLFELLTGQPLGRTHVSRHRHHLHMQARMPSVERHAGEGVCALLRDMLAWSANERPATEVVEERCRRLRMQEGGESLKRWARGALRALMAERQRRPARETSSPTPLSGRTFVVQQSSGARLRQSEEPDAGGHGAVITLAETSPELRAREERARSHAPKPVAASDLGDQSQTAGEPRMGEPPAPKPDPDKGSGGWVIGGLLGLALIGAGLFADAWERSATEHPDEPPPIEDPETATVEVDPAPVVGEGGAGAPHVDDEGGATDQRVGEGEDDPGPPIESSSKTSGEVDPKTEGGVAPEAEGGGAPGEAEPPTTKGVSSGSGGPEPLTKEATPSPDPRPTPPLSAAPPLQFDVGPDFGRPAVLRLTNAKGEEFSTTRAIPPGKYTLYYGPAAETGRRTVTIPAGGAQRLACLQDGSDCIDPTKR